MEKVNGKMVKKLEDVLKVLKKLQAGEIEEFNFSKLDVDFNYTKVNLNNVTLLLEDKEGNCFFEINDEERYFDTLNKGDKLVGYTREKIEELLKNPEKIKKTTHETVGMKSNIHIYLGKIEEKEFSRLYKIATENSITDLLVSKNKEDLNDLIKELGLPFEADKLSRKDRNRLYNKISEIREFRTFRPDSFTKYDKRGFFTLITDDYFWSKDDLETGKINISDIPNYLLLQILKNSNVKCWMFDELEEIGANFDEYIDLQKLLKVQGSFKSSVNKNKRLFSRKDILEYIKRKAKYDENIVLVNKEDAYNYECVLIDALLYGKVLE